jgi:superfamily I DNA/RNA helicase
MGVSVAQGSLLPGLQDELGLNAEQVQAASHYTGPGFVTAPAGSGKTVSVVARLLNLVKLHKVPAKQILCITFTNKATDNMLRRFKEKLGDNVENLPFVSTIHSLGMKIIREHPNLAARALAKLADESYQQEIKAPPVQSLTFGDAIATPQPKTNWLSIWSERNQETVVKEIAAELGYTATRHGDILDSILYLTSRAYTPDTYEKAMTSGDKKVRCELHFLPEREIEIWRLYLKAKWANHAIDFSDMMLLPVVLLRDHPAVLKAYHDRWSFVMQDEAQDASPLQWDLITLLTNPVTNNIYAVGDLAQCQPPGTMVMKCSESGVTEVAIESLQDGDQVVSWTDQGGNPEGQRIKVAKNHYKGPLLSLVGANGSVTRVTPEHWVWCRISQDSPWVKKPAKDLFGGSQLQIPVLGTKQSTLLFGVVIENYEGPVYSLEVENDHTYVADGIVVGNSIYRFNGADPSILRSFLKDFRGVTPSTYVLTKNYRSNDVIVQAANGFEQKEVHEHQLGMEAKNSQGLGIFCYKEHATPQVEAEEIARTIRNMTSSVEQDRLRAFLRAPKASFSPGAASLRPGFKPNPPAVRAQPPVETKPPVQSSQDPKIQYKDIAILVRTKAQLPQIENALLVSHIPYYVKDSYSLLQSKEATDLLAYLKLVVNPWDSVAFFRAAQTPKRGVGEISLQKLEKDAYFQGIDLVTASKSVAKLFSFNAALEALQQGIAEDISQIGSLLDKLTTAINYNEILSKTARDRDDKIRREETLRRFILLCQDLVTKNTVQDAPSLLDFLFLSSDSTTNAPEDNKVHVMTAHSAKGLEWHTVFAPNFFQGALPYHRSLKNIEEVTEEARLLYVIVTRAKQNLYLSRPQCYQTYSGNTQMTQRSQFFPALKPFFTEMHCLN